MSHTIFHDANIAAIHSTQIDDFHVGNSTDGPVSMIGVICCHINSNNYFVLFVQYKKCQIVKEYYQLLLKVDIDVKEKADTAVDACEENTSLFMQQLMKMSRNHQKIIGF